MSADFFPNLAQRLFNRPLAITADKASIILGVLADRLGIARVRLPDGRMRAFDGDGMVVTADPPEDDGPGYEIIAGVAVIDVRGVLVQRQLGVRPLSGMTGYNALRLNFCSAHDDPEVRAIAFDIDSPGGDVAGLFGLTDLVHACRGTKPIWAILDESACSAAFAIAAACDRVVVPRTGYSGSIGCIVLHADLSRLLDREGITISIIQYGARKADGQPAIPLSDPAREQLQADVNEVGELFVQSVARYRGLSTDRVRSQEAATYLGRAGCDAGLVDAVMEPVDAFGALVKLAAAHKSPPPSGGVRVPSRDEMLQRRAIASPNMRRLRRLGIFPPMAS